MPATRLKVFAEQYHIVGLSDSTLARLDNGSYRMEKADAFLSFRKRIGEELLTHPVITQNPYTRWFSTADLNDAQVKYFIIQFSVFSNQFLVAQLQKMIIADSIEEMRASKEILANELGVLFNDKGDKTSIRSVASDGKRDFGGLDGSIQGGRFHFRAAHFELLVRMAERLGLDFRLLGKRKKGKPSTLFFCDELIRLYGSENTQTANAASFAVENWAAAGFWDQLVAGLNRYKTSRNIEKLPLAFFSWNSRLEANYAHHTQEELERFYFSHDVDEDEFVNVGNDMLDAVFEFWVGMDRDRLKLH